MSSLFAADQLVIDCPYQDAAVVAGPSQPTTRDVWFSVATTLFGVDTFGQTDSAPRHTFTGFLQDAVNSFLYGKLYVDPAVLALGNLVSSQTRQISVWNATFAALDVTSVASSNDEGLTLVPPLAAPFVLGPLQEVFYTLSISPNGPAVLAASYDFLVSGVNYTVTVTGSRVTLWPFAPNWASPVNESLEWMTDVLKSFDASEQRASLRSHPRRRMSFDFLIFKADTQQFDNITWGWQNRSFAVPYWQYKAKTTAIIPAGTVLVPMDTTTSGFVAGQTLVLFQDTDVYEVLQIASVTANSVTLANPTVLEWPAGAQVYPVGVSLLESNIPVHRETSRALRGSVNFLSDPVSTDPFVPAVAATNLYLGVEIILTQPDWVTAIDNAAMFDYDTVDFKTGAKNTAVTALYQSLAYKYRWILTSRTEVNAFRAFLGRLKGQLNAVYLPSWHEDFTLASDILLTDTSITVIDRNFYNLVGLTPARANIMIRTKTHGDFLRPILTAGLGTGNTVVIGISAALGVMIPMSDIRAISYVSLYRKSSDMATIQWQTDEVAIIEEAFELVAA